MIDLQLISQCPSVATVLGKLPSGALAVCTDTRSYKNPALFIAFPGARFNPLENLAALLEAGCPLVVYQTDGTNDELVKRWRQKFSATCFVGVKDAVTFSQELAERHATQWQKDGRVIFAISGSNGKTTHKEMLAFLLRAHWGNKVVATEKNNNNHLGVPLTLFNLSPESRVCVLELGSNHPGEIKVLCDIARPHAGLVTNIGATHMEFFGTEEKVFDEEGWLYHSVHRDTGGNGFFLQNLDDPFLKSFPRTPGLRTFSRNPGADYHITPTQDGVKVCGLLEVVLTNPSLTGAHNKQNMAVAWIIASTLFPEARSVFAKAAGDFRPTKNRSEWCEFDGKKVYLDAYNANPSSMKVALEGFFEWTGQEGIPEEKTLVVLGDMNELGDNAASYHAEVGAFLKRWPKCTVVFVGRYAANYVMGLGGGETFPEAAALKGEALKRLTHGRTHLFIKGSRSLQLESLLAIT